VLPVQHINLFFKLLEPCHAAHALLFFFFGGLSIHLSQALHVLLFSYNITRRA
jgi:hypothetical protein